MMNENNVAHEIWRVIDEYENYMKYHHMGELEILIR